MSTDNDFMSLSYAELINSEYLELKNREMARAGLPRAACYYALAVALRDNAKFHAADGQIDTQTAVTLLRNFDIFSETIRDVYDFSDGDLSKFTNALCAVDDWAFLVESIKTFWSSLAEGDYALLSATARRVDFASTLLTEKLCDHRDEVLNPLDKKRYVVMSSVDIGAAAGKSTEGVRLFFTDNENATPPNIKNGRKYYDTRHLVEYATAYDCYPRKKITGRKTIKGAVANQKGGVGKTSTLINIAHHFALQGYSVLCVDLDPQASTSALSAKIGLFEVDRKYILEDCFLNENYDLKGAVQKVPNWPNVDIIPSNICAQSVEWDMANLQMEDGGVYSYKRLDTALKSIEDDYDIILFDTPPSLNLFNLSALYASDFMVSPVSPEPLDIDSTMFYYQYLIDFAEGHMDDKEHYFSKVVLSNVKTTNVNQRFWCSLIRSALGDIVFEHEIPNTTAMSSAYLNFCSLYEADKEMCDRQTLKRGRDAMTAFCNELQAEMESIWDLVGN